jgi:hypothetical protein
VEGRLPTYHAPEGGFIPGGDCASAPPIKAVFRETAITLVIGLIVALAFATWGSLFVVKRALVPVQKIALAVQALPVVHPDENNKGNAVLEEIANLCVTLNEMVDQLEDSFQIGTGLSVEPFTRR